MSKFFTEHDVRSQTMERTLSILTYEVANILQCEEDGALDKSIMAAFKSHAQTEVGDAISMLRYYCEQSKTNYRELKADITAKQISDWSEANQIPARMSIYTGHIVQAHHYTYVFGSTLWHVKLAPALGALKFLLYFYCICNNWNSDIVERMGEEHYLERMAHICKEGIQR